MIKLIRDGFNGGKWQWKYAVHERCLDNKPTIGNRLDKTLWFDIGPTFTSKTKAYSFLAERRNNHALIL